jgi:cytochrome c oxidase subunit III
MEIGTAKPAFKPKKHLKRRLSFSEGLGSGGNGKNGGGGGGSNGGDGNKPNFQDFEDIDQPKSNKARILTVFLLLVVLMTFGGLIGAYIVISTNTVMECKPFSLPFQVWLSTAIILASSLSYHISKKALDQNKQEKSKKWLLITTVLGAAFISSQILSWLALVNRGVYVQSNPYAGFFYILTAVHAVHVFGGICALGSIVLRTWHKTFDDEELRQRKNLSNVVGWYWHTMDALWIVLFLLLGFWK